jgi:hypothetical protein
MPKNDDADFKGEVEGRLSEFFGAPNIDGPPQKEIEPDASAFSQFKELKAAVLSVEWEINDESIARLIDETERLQGLYSDNPVTLSFLKLLGSVGKYVGSKKAKAHPESIKLLHSIFKKFEAVLTSSVLDELETKKILSAEFSKFKALKQKLMVQTPGGLPVEKDSKTVKKTKPASPPAEEEEIGLNGEATAKTRSEKSVKPESSTPALSALTPSQDILLNQLEEIKRLIKEEFENIRAELKMLIQ